MTTRAELVKNIKNEFPRITFPEDYAELILAGIKLQAIDSDSSRRRKDFFVAGKIKVHVFNNSYLKLGLLVAIKGADRLIVLVSRRAGVFLFNFSRAREILNMEKESLFAHIVSDPSIKKHVTSVLKLSSASSIDVIRTKMNSGDLMKQAGTYDKVFRNLTKNGVRPKGYMWFGVRTIPISHYYLSSKSKKLLQ